MSVGGITGPYMLEGSTLLVICSKFIEGISEIGLGMDTQLIMLVTETDFSSATLGSRSTIGVHLYTGGSIGKSIGINFHSGMLVSFLQYNSFLVESSLCDRKCSMVGQLGPWYSEGGLS